jgi:hypothetical protein
MGAEAQGICTGRAVVSMPWTERRIRPGWNVLGRKSLRHGNHLTLTEGVLSKDNEIIS